ncbi:hypothetical protein SZ63_07680 [Methanoculleus sediminis]|uniref:Uncharacterized protein n=1 Tax=Methanoculleus sediminis TaxID=1550566 RepID=A0A0H1QYM9_9EURY|nr:ATP-binding protein [Methanoculleus sediminis]KLK87894.1 hypothetical protein SZ63_07680 [Methanoculleus sediminis]
MLPVGSPATGDDFIDRERETAFILDTIEKDHVMLVAPRRFGKTSIMRKIERDLESRHKPCVFLEVESVNSPGEFITDLVTALVECGEAGHKTRIFSALEKAFARLQENIDEIETPVFRAKLRSRLRAEFSDDWHEKAKRLDAIFAGIDRPVCIILDEFPVAIQNMEADDARTFLHWFRRLRQDSPGVRFIVGGSVSIDHVVYDVGGTPVINDFRRVGIGGFEEGVALSVVERVFQDEGWSYSPETGRAVLDCVGDPCIPYFLMIVLSGLKEEIEISGGAPSPALVDRVYNKRILGSEGRHYFEHYSRRLRITYSDAEAKAARAILGRVSAAESLSVGIAYEIFRRSTASESEDAFLALLAQLNHDFYVAMDTPGELRFYSKMLRDWWRIYHAGTG